MTRSPRARCACSTPRRLSYSTVRRGSPRAGPRVCLFSASRTVTDFPLRVHAELSPQQTAAYIVAHTHLEQRITKLWQSLPPVHAAHGNGDDNGAAARARVLVHAV